MTPAMFYLVVAVALISTELLIMQFSVFWFLFFGIGALVTSLIAWLVPDISWFASTLLFLVASVGVSALIYPKLRKWQNKASPIAGNDAIGQNAEVIEAITQQKNGKVIWSGTDWPAQLAAGEAEFNVGDTAKILKLKGIRLIVGR